MKNNERSVDGGELPLPSFVLLVAVLVLMRG
jgi:hypothetical protein